MDTRKAHAHIWEKVRPFDGESVLYAFRFANGVTKFGKSTNIRSRTGDHLANGITRCTGVTVVPVEPEMLHEAERAVLRHVASKYRQKANEVFSSSPSEEDDETMIRRAIDGLPRSAPAYLPHPAPPAPFTLDEQRRREARTAEEAEWRVRHPTVSMPERPADTLRPSERYSGPWPPFRSNHLPAQKSGAETITPEEEYQISYVRFTKVAARFEGAYRKYTRETDVITGIKTALAITGAYLAGYAHPIDAKLAKRIVRSDLPCVIELEAAVKELKRHGPLSDVLARVCSRQPDGGSGYSGCVVKLSRWGDRYLYGLTPVVQLAFRIAGLGELY